MGATQLHAENHTSHLTPYMYAEVHGISLRVHEGVPFAVASNGDTVVYAPHCDDRVNAARAWQGIAQCLLTRAGRRWSLNDARALGLQLQRRHQRIQ